MRKFIFTLFFVLLMSVPAFASDFPSVNYTYIYNNLSYSVTIDDCTNLSDTVSDADARIYVYYNYHDNGSHILFVGDVPFSVVYTVKQGANINTYTYTCNQVSNWYPYNGCGGGALNGPSSVAGVSGYYGFSLWLDSSIMADNVSGFYKSFDNIYAPYAYYPGSELVAYIADDFFQLPPTLSNQETTGEVMTVGKVIYSFLLSGVGLVILLVAFLILVTLLVRYLRRALSL